MLKQDTVAKVHQRVRITGVDITLIQIENTQNWLTSVFRDGAQVAGGIFVWRQTSAARSCLVLTLCDLKAMRANETRYFTMYR